MSEMAPGARRNVLLFSAVAEVATGLVLLLDPAILARLLLGAELAWLGVSGQAGGPLLWPVAALHGAVALLLVWTGRK